MKVSFWSFGTSVGGYGILNNLWAKHLTRAGVDVRISPDFSPKPGSREWDILDSEEKAIYSKPFEVCKVGISGTTPFEFGYNKSPIKIAMTMAESDNLGKEWVDSCNSMTHIFVPNDFFASVFVDSGVTVPVTVLKNGIDTERFPVYNRPERDVYTFGICGYLNERKGALDVVQAFISEFSKDEPVALKLHTTNGFFRYYKYTTDPRISLSYDHKTYGELYEWYKSLDCFVFPSKSEGIGYPPREAISTGLPTIITKWSGLQDIANEFHSYPLEVVALTPRQDILEQPGNWAMVDIKEVMYWMRYVYENRQTSKQKGMAAGLGMRKAYNWTTCVRPLIKFISQYEK